MIQKRAGICPAFGSAILEWFRSCPIPSRRRPMAWRLRYEHLDLTAIRHLQWLRRLDPVVTFLSKGNPMKRFLASALIIGISSFGLVGCEEKAKDQIKETTTTPGGSTTTTTTVEEKKTGDHKDSEKEKTVPVTPETPK
jgi:hypothetical protein